MYKSLKELLLKITDSGRQEPKTSLITLIKAVDAWALEHASTADKQLLHFVRGRSYVKALQWVNSHEAS